MYRVNEENLISYWERERFPCVIVSWKNSDNCTPIEDLRIWQKTLGYMCGVYGNVIEINKYCKDLIVDSKEFISYCPDGTDKDIGKLLWGYEGPHFITDKLRFIDKNNENNKVVVKVSDNNFLPNWYGDIVATVF